MTVTPIQTIELNGRRRIAVHRLAEGDSGRTIVLCHPAPGAGNFDPDPEVTWARGATLLAVDRPGYGHSDPLPDAAWATVHSAAEDLAAILDRQSTGPVGVAGWSAGGRVALALAAQRPDLVDRVVVLCTPAPHEEVPWIPPEIEAGLQRLVGLPSSDVHAILRQQLAALVPGDPTSAFHLLGASPADDAALSAREARERLGQMLEAAFLQGASGMAGDIAGYCLRPWEFEPGAVEAKVLLLYGAQDPVAGPRHGKWWQRRLSNARLEVSPDSGHLLILKRWNRVLSHLAPHARRQS